MIQTQNIHSLTDFQRNTSTHMRQLRATGLPEILTIKGRAELIVQAADAYQALISKLDLYESAIAINRGIQQVRDGQFTTFADFDKRIRSKLASPRRKS